MKKILLLLILILLTGFGSGKAEDSDTSPVLNETLVSFRDFYAKVIGRTPELLKQYATIEEALADKYRAFSGFLPKGGGQASVEMGDDPVYVFGTLLRQKAFSQEKFGLSSLNTPRHRTNFHFGLTGEIPLFNAFQTISRYRMSRSLLKSEESMKEHKLSEAGLIAFEAYLRVLLEEELEAIAARVRKDSDEDLRQAEDLKEKGMVLGADFFAAKVTLAGLRQEAQKTRFNWKKAQVFAAILMGAEANREVRFSRNETALMKPVEKLDQWIQKAKEGRKDYQALKERLEAARQNIFREQMSILPRVHGFGTVTEDTNNWSTGGGHYLMGFRANMDFLDPDYWPRVQKAKAAYRELETEKTRLEDEMASFLSAEYTGLQIAMSDYEILSAAFNDSEEAVKQTALLYREGRKSIADVVEIRRVFLQTAFLKAQAYFEWKLAQSRLYFFSGALDLKQLMELAGERA